MIICKLIVRVIDRSNCCCETDVLRLHYPTLSFDWSFSLLHFMFFIFRERPVINSSTLSLDYLHSLPDGTFGKVFAEWLASNVREKRCSFHFTCCWTDIRDLCKPGSDSMYLVLVTRLWCFITWTCTNYLVFKLIRIVTWCLWILCASYKCLMLELVSFPAINFSISEKYSSVAYNVQIYQRCCFVV